MNIDLKSLYDSITKTEVIDHAGTDGTYEVINYYRKATVDNVTLDYTKVIVNHISTGKVYSVNYRLIILVDSDNIPSVIFDQVSTGEDPLKSFDVFNEYITNNIFNEGIPLNEFNIMTSIQKHFKITKC